MDIRAFEPICLCTVLCMDRLALIFLLKKECDYHQQNNLHQKCGFQCYSKN